SVSASNSGLAVGAPIYGGSIGATAPTSAQLLLTVSPAASLGPKNIAVTAGGSTSVLSGVVVIMNPQPSNILVAPASGSVVCGTAATDQRRYPFGWAAGNAGEYYRRRVQFSNRGYGRPFQWSTGECRKYDPDQCDGPCTVWRHEWTGNGCRSRSNSGRTGLYR